MNAKTRLLARSALGSALGVVCLLLCSLLPAARLALLCLSSLGVCFVRMSCGSKWALGAYIVTAVLTLMLLPQKGAALAYALFAGYYPLVQLRLERTGSRALRYAVKLILFNAVFAVLFFAAGELFFAGRLAQRRLLLFLTADIAFLVYDYALSQLILLYIRKIARRIH